MVFLLSTRPQHRQRTGNEQTEEELLAKPGTTSGDLQRALLALLYEHKADGTLPTNNRFLFYELEQRGVLSKHVSGTRRPDQDLQDAMRHLREIGLVPWSWIEDGTRDISVPMVSSSIHQGLIDRIPLVRLNPWTDEPAPILIVESRSLKLALTSLAWEYAVPLCSTNGQSRGFLMTEVLPCYIKSKRVGTLGDLDLSGGHIEANTKRVLEEAGGPADLWVRLAITPEQVRARKITPIIKRDRRYSGDGGEHNAWETEALGQKDIVDIVRRWLDSLLPEPLALVQEREKREREAEVRWFKRHPRRGRT